MTISSRRTWQRATISCKPIEIKSHISHRFGINPRKKSNWNSVFTQCCVSHLPNIGPAILSICVILLSLTSKIKLKLKLGLVFLFICAKLNAWTTKCFKSMWYYLRFFCLSLYASTTNKNKFLMLFLCFYFSTYFQILQIINDLFIVGLTWAIRELKLTRHNVSAIRVVPVLCMTAWKHKILPWKVRMFCQ